jgi:hypothetical protein
VWSGRGLSIWSGPGFGPARAPGPGVWSSPSSGPKRLVRPELRAPAPGTGLWFGPGTRPIKSKLFVGKETTDNHTSSRPSISVGHYGGSVMHMEMITLLSDFVGAWGKLSYFETWAAHTNASMHSPTHTAPTYPHKHMHMHTYTYTHSQTHTLTHKHTHRYTQTCKHIRTHMYM